MPAAWLPAHCADQRRMRRQGVECLALTQVPHLGSVVITTCTAVSTVQHSIQHSTAPYSLLGKCMQLCLRDGHSWNNTGSQTLHNSALGTQCWSTDSLSSAADMLLSSNAHTSLRTCGNVVPVWSKVDGQDLPDMTLQDQHTAACAAVPDATCKHTQNA